MNVLLAGLSSDRVECRLAGAVQDAGVNLTAVCEPDSRGARECRARHIPTLEMTFRHRLDRNAIRMFREHLQTGAFDIFHCLTNRALSTALWACRGRKSRPRILAYRGTTGHLSPWDPAARLSYLHPRLDGIVCLSDAVRRYLLTRGVPDHKLHVILKGHELEWYRRADRSELTALGIANDAFVVGFCGNVRPVKGLDVLLDAFEQWTPASPAHLLVMGHVPTGPIARRLARMPRVHATGFRADAAALAGACDIGVVPSVAREGLSKAAIEFMAQGVPVVASGVGGLPEAVIHEQSGLIVPPRDPEALARSLDRLASNPAERAALGRAARERVAGPLHFRHTAEKTLALYRSLAGADRTGWDGTRPLRSTSS